MTAPVAQPAALLLLLMAVLTAGRAQPWTGADTRADTTPTAGAARSLLASNSPASPPTTSRGPPGPSYPGPSRSPSVPPPRPPASSPSSATSTNPRPSSPPSPAPSSPRPPAYPPTRDTSSGPSKGPQAPTYGGARPSPSPRATVSVISPEPRWPALPRSPSPDPPAARPAAYPPSNPPSPPRPASGAGRPAGWDDVNFAVAVMNYTGLTSGAVQNSTIFMPTDQAFRIMTKVLKIESPTPAELFTPALKNTTWDVLKFHVVPNRIIRSADIPEGVSQLGTMFWGKKFTVTKVKACRDASDGILGPAGRCLPRQTGCECKLGQARFSITVQGPSNKLPGNVLATDRAWGTNIVHFTDMVMLP